MGTQNYFPSESDQDIIQKGFNPFKNREQRLLAELFQVARMVQELMLASIYHANKYEYDLKFGTFKNFLQNTF